MAWRQLSTSSRIHTGHRVDLATSFVPTLKKAGKEAVLPSHQLLLRAGLVRQSASGIYTLLPHAVRVLDKISRVIHAEMQAIGGQHMVLPCLTQRALWETSGRWATASELFTPLTGRHRQGPTHEEAITDVVAQHLHSHRQLPLLCYQLDRKYRDEIRPRYGLLRAREFWMKDMYTFDASLAACTATYNAVCEAYSRIFAALDLDVVRVEADAGDIGGDCSHEYHVRSNVGEDILLTCDSCGVAANQEKARSVAAALSVVEQPPTSALDTEILRRLGFSFDGPVSLAAFMHPGQVRQTAQVSTGQLTLAVGGAPQATVSVLAVSRSDRQINAAKIKAHLATALVPVDIMVPSRVPWPCGGPAVVVLDDAVMGAPTTAAIVHRSDISLATNGDACAGAACAGRLHESRGIEVGHAFVLKEKYSAPFHAKFTNEHGVEKLAQMGCFGLGVTRILQAIVETHHDSNGIVWPEIASPYRIAVLTMNESAGHVDKTSSKAYITALQLYDSLAAIVGVRGDVVLDTRDDCTNGVKLVEAGLLGFPYVVIVNKDTTFERVEVKDRRRGTTTHVRWTDFVSSAATAPLPYS